MKDLLLFLTIGFLLLSCQRSQEDQVVARKQISEVKIEPEFKLAAYAGSIVQYAEVGETSLRTDDLAYADAHLQGDTLRITVKPASSLSELLSGWGIAVTVVGNKFSSTYYEWSDTDVDGATVNAEYNKLTLNTGKYAKGDTIAGKLFYRSVEANDGLGGKKRKYASGFFRAIIN